jgi:uncharacterized protein (DUF1501 family)
MVLLTRRATLMGLTAIATSSRVKLAMANAPTDQRFVVVLLRGALDGMSSVVPYGDPALAALRPALIPPAPGQTGGMYDLGGFFGLNPSLKNVYAMYQAGEVLPVHAVAGPYRTRSHFEAQDLLQLGTETTGITSGWLNRVLAELPANQTATLAGLSVGIATPLLLQGPVRVGAYADENFAIPAPDLYARIAALNANDPLTGPAIANGLRGQAFDAQVADADAAPAADIMSDDPSDKPAARRASNNFPALATRAGQLLAAPGGPRIAAFQLEGWDTHGNQVNGLKVPLSGLDNGLLALKTALGPVWGKTMVLVVTEFGRTAAMNGTQGTDHGTATAALILGGNVAGGRVVATWPGLSGGQLFENRDLAPTMDVRSVAKGALKAHLGLGDAALARVFPASGDAAPLNGITRNA